MNGRLGSLVLVVIAFTGATVCGARLLRAAFSQLPIHAAGYWTTPSGNLEPWQGDLRIDGDDLSGQFSAQLDGQVIRGTVEGSAKRDRVVVLLRSEAGEPLATVSGHVDGATLSGEITAVEEGSQSSQTAQWSGGWYGDAPQTEIEPAPTPVAGSSVMPEAFRQRSDVLAADAAVECSDRLVNTPTPIATQNEPEIAVDRLNDPNRLVAAAIDYSLPPGRPRVFWYFSSDGGATWPADKRGPILLPTPANKSADPSVDYDADGNPFLAALAYKDDGAPDDMDAIIVARSPDHGATFTSTTTVASNQAAPAVGLDKPWLAVDRSASSAYRNRVHVVWTESSQSNDVTTTAVRLATSSNHGQYFAANPVSIATASSADEDKAVGLPNVAVSADGTVYVIWLLAIHNNDPVLLQTSIRVRRCGMGGAVCEAGDNLVADINAIPDHLTGATFFTGNMPAVAFDTTSGAGTIYVVWSEYRKDLPTPRADIFFTKQYGGNPWLSKTAVVSDTYDAFFPAVSIDANHFVNITYYKRVDFVTNGFNAYEIRSGPSATNFGTPVQLNCVGPITPTTDPGIGDYISNDSAISRHHIWMDTRNGNQDVYMTTTSGC